MPGLRLRHFGTVALVVLVLGPVWAITALSLLGQQAAAIQGHRENLDSRRAAVELEECLTDLVALEDAWVDAVAVLHERVRVLLEAVERTADQPEERALTAQIQTGFAAYLARWQGLPPADGPGHEPARRVVTRALEMEVLQPCRELEVYNARRIDESTTAHDHMLGWLAWGMAGIGGVIGMTLGYVVSHHRGLNPPHDDAQTAVATLSPWEAEVLQAEQMAAVGQLAAGVGHELRNPLTSVKLLVQAGLEDGGLPADDLRVIDGEVRRMEQSLQTFLDFARPPKADRRPTALVPLIREVSDLLRSRAEMQRVGLHLDLSAAGATVRGDRDQLRQVVGNLMLNALDAMPAGGTLTVAVREADLGRVEVEVADTGVGIPPAQMPRLFLPFASTKDTGLGLGLAISKRIVDDHAGTLGAANRRGGGTSFVITLPAEPTHAPPAGG